MRAAARSVGFTSRFPSDLGDPIFFTTPPGEPGGVPGFPLPPPPPCRAPPPLPPPAAPHCFCCAALRGFHHMLDTKSTTLLASGVAWRPRLARMALRMVNFKSVPVKWCSDAYMYCTRVSGSDAAKRRHAGMDT